MSPLTMLLSLMIPMLAVAIPISDEATPHTLFPSIPLGDVLNVTQCYCHNFAPLSPNGTIGYYYLFDYYNWHLNRTYSINMTCNSSAPDNANGTKPEKCMDHISKQKKHCAEYSDGNEFCYRFKEAVDKWDEGTPSASQYWFNGQKRDVPAIANAIMDKDNLTEQCAFHCGKEVGGMMTYDDYSSLMPGIGMVSNKVGSYSVLDDMCYTCAA